MIDHVQDIKEKLDIVEIIGDYVRLRKVGKNFRGLCPFHSEKTPSFYVSPERQTYHCFGCGNGGDLFSFIMEAESIDFREALELLGKRAGIDIAEKRTEARGKNLYDVMELACQFYQCSLHSDRGESARKYLKKRSISMDLTSAFEIGWASASWDSLWTWLKDHQISFKDALECGLVLEGKHGPYDRFRGRLIFPIRDIVGKLIAFGGRLVDGDGAKYINSPEGSLYSKRQNLYLLNKAKRSIREKGRAILVEGYMDAIRLHVSGYPETVASLGTSLTEEQASLLKRLADKCYICYDSDAAGQDATIRGMYILQRLGLDVFIVQIPQGKDPDDLLSLPQGRDLFEEMIVKAKPLVLYHLYMGRNGGMTGSRRSTDEFLVKISQLPLETVSQYLNHISRELGILPHILQDQLHSLRKQDQRKSSEVGRDRIERQTDNLVANDIEPLQAALFTLLWNNPDIRKTTTSHNIISLFEDERMQTITSALISGEDPVDLEKRWLLLGEKFAQQVIAKGGSYLEQFPEKEGLCSVIIESLERKKKITRYKILKGKLIRMEASGEELKEYSQLSSELKDVVF